MYARIDTVHLRMCKKVKKVYADLDAINDKLGDYHTEGLLDGFSELLAIFLYVYIYIRIFLTPQWRPFIKKNRI